MSREIVHKFLQNKDSTFCTFLKIRLNSKEKNKFIGFRLSPVVENLKSKISIKNTFFPWVEKRKGILMTTTANNSKIVHKQILLCQTTAEGPARFGRFANSACLPTSQEQKHDLSNCRLSGWSDGQLRGMSAELTSNDKDVAWVDTEWPNGLAISQTFSVNRLKNKNSDLPGG